MLWFLRAKTSEGKRGEDKDFLTPCLTPKKPLPPDCDAVVEISPSLSFEFARPRANYGHLGPEKEPISH